MFLLPVSTTCLHECIQVTVEISELTANVSFSIENGTNGSVSQLVVSRPLQPGVHDVLIVAYCDRYVSFTWAHSYYKITIEVTEGWLGYVLRCSVSFDFSKLFFIVYLL